MPKKDPNPCKCIIGVNKVLDAKGVELHTAFTLTGRVYPLLAVNSSASGRPTTKVTLTPSFCPFCGVDLQDAKTPKRKSRSKASTAKGGK